MVKGNYLIVYEKNNVSHKVCRVIFGSDGSYYVTSPFHPINKAVLIKLTVKYGDYMEEDRISYEEALDMASLDDDDKRLKLTHHPSGFIQFSGQGIVSGKDTQGNPKGVGIQSWPLAQPVNGPSFCVALLGLEQFQQIDKPKGGLCIFRDSEFPSDSTSNGFILEGFYFSANRRRFIQTEPDGTKTMNLVHPTGSVIRLEVLLPPDACPLQGFIGITLYRSPVLFDEDSGVSCAYMLSSSTGNMRRNERGDLIADSLYCIYPRTPEMPIRCILNYRPDKDVEVDT